MLSDQRGLALVTTTSSSSTTRDVVDDGDDEDDELTIREIHALTPPSNHRHPQGSNRRREAWETSSHRSSSLSMATAPSEGTSGEQFSSISREFNALVLAGSRLDNPDNNGGVRGVNPNNNNNDLGRIGEDETPEETNPLAIVPDYNYNNPTSEFISDAVASSTSGGDRHRAIVAAASAQVTVAAGGEAREVSLQRVKKEEIETKINAWQTAKIAKVNNRFKREDAVINGWESEQVQKASSWMKKVERKLEEKRAKAMEKMQNEIAKARRKSEERRASAEARRGRKVAGILEIANLMRAVGRAPAKRSFF